MAIQKYKGHLALLGAAIMWGLMSPIGKTALENGISGLSLATFRMTGGAICFWIASIFAPKEQVKPHDLMMLFFAGLLGIVLNQGCFTFGLSLTSPIDASIVTTTAPIATMIVAAIYLKEPVTGKKVIGIFLGSIGALTLILTENIAPYCHQYVQLCAAYCRNQCLYLVRNGNLRCCQRNSCGTGIHGSLYCNPK